MFWPRPNGRKSDGSKEPGPQRLLTWPRLLILAAVYCFVALAFRPTSLLDIVSSGDDTSYISHAFTTALDFDLQYQNEPIFSPGPRHLLAPSGRVPAHPVGPGLMAAPFVAFFSIFDHIADNPIIRDHKHYAGSWSLFGFFIAAASWSLFGAWLYMNALEAAGAKTSRWTILLFVSGMSLPYYIFVRPTMGHAFEFASVALVFWGATRFMIPGKLDRAIPEIGMVAGVLLTMLVRMADVNVLLLPVVVWGLLMLCRHGDWPALTFRRDGLVLVTATVIALLIWIVLNRALYGVAMPGIGATYGYGQFFPMPSGGLLGIAWECLRSVPLLWPMLTTSEFGLVYSSPILPAGMFAIALILANKWRQKELVAVVTGITCAIYMAMPISIMLIWKTTGESFGYRYLFDLLPISLLGTVLFLNEAGRVAKVAKPALALLSVWSLIGVMFVNTNPGLTTRRDVNALGRLSSFSMVGYETNLVTAVMTPRAWFNMAARRLPGFVAIRFVAAPNDLIRDASSGPSDAPSAIDRIKRAGDGLFVAIVLFGLFYPLCLVFLCDDVVSNRAFNLLRRRLRRGIAPYLG